MDGREIRVRECAYYFWEEEGRPSGRAQIHWQMAEIAIALMGYLSISQQERTRSIDTVHPRRAEPISPA